MKKIYFLLAIFFFSFCGAQNINFPDAIFKGYLTSSSTGFSIASNQYGNPIKVDINDDGEIQASEALLIYRISLPNIYISDLTGIQNFLNLESLNIVDNSTMHHLDLSNLTNFKNLIVSECALNSIITQGCTQLEYVNISKNSGTLSDLNFLSGNTAMKDLMIDDNFSSVDLVNLTSLQKLSISQAITNNYNFTSLDLSTNVNLKNIFISKQNLGSLILAPMPQLTYCVINYTIVPDINLSGATSLDHLQVTGNTKLTNLNLQNCSNLVTLLVSSNYILPALDVQNLPNLKTFNVTETAVSSLNFMGTSGITSLSIGFNNITSIDFSNFPQLESLSFSENISTLDVSQNPLLTNLSVQGLGANKINMKNGNPNLNFDPINFYGFPNLQYVCCDDNLITQIQNKLIAKGHNNVQVNSYCSFSSGGTVYTLQGETKFDLLSDGCDATDPIKPLQKFGISGTNGSGSLIGNLTGEYLLPFSAGSHTITPILENPTYFNISPTNFAASFPAMASPLSQNFCLTANGNHNDLEIVIIPINAARPGFVSEYKVLFKNKGTATQAGSFSFNYDDNLMNFLSSSLATASQSFGVLNYNFTNLLPFQTRELTVKFTLNTPTATPPLTGGDILNYTAQINGATDETPLDNTFTLIQTVVNSFDPNDKTCLEGTAISQTKVGDYVHYLIRFENTGTANAENIVVKDMIDTTKFEINSLVAMNGSHSFVTRITNPNTVEFIFENIQLPFNDLYNDGYVSFKIKTKSTLVLGDSFSNTANIYFDYNAPIVTNTATTTVAQILGTQETSIEKSLSFYPNPVEDVIHFKSDKKLLKLEIYDVSGRIVGSINIQNNEANLSFLKTGNYLMKIFTKDRYYVIKIVKK